MMTGRGARSWLVLFVTLIIAGVVSFGVLSLFAPSQDGPRPVASLPVATLAPAPPPQQVEVPVSEPALSAPVVAEIEPPPASVRPESLSPRQASESPLSPSALPPQASPPADTSVATLPPVSRSVETPQATPAPSPTPLPPVQAVPNIAPPKTDQLTALPSPVLRPAGDLPQWRRNAVAVGESGGRPMIAVVIDDMGLNQRRSAAMVNLPGPLTMSYLPYAIDLLRQTAAARAQGHELMVHVSMQAIGGDNPGPNALTIDLPPDEIKQRLNWALTRFEGYVGINNHMGSRFTADRDGMAVVMTELKAHGLLFIDSRTGPRSLGSSSAAAHGVPHAARHVFLDHDINAEAIARQIAETEQTALQTGYAVAIGHPHDLTIKALADWLPTLSAKGFVQVPVSAIVARTETRPGTNQSSMAPKKP